MVPAPASARLQQRSRSAFLCGGRPTAPDRPPAKKTRVGALLGRYGLTSARPTTPPSSLKHNTKEARGVAQHCVHPLQGQI